MSDPAAFDTRQRELSTPPLKIAVEGCCHGSLDYIYESLEKTCESRGWTIAELDLLIICGDFHAIRNAQDLNCMSVPRRYRNMGDFHRYYSGERQAPVLTLVIGGNHEASNYFSELHYGGWLAPNIYYLGAVNVVRYGPLRIASLSGIFNGAHYHKPHHERLPYDRNEIRSIYHVRECDVAKLLQIRSPVDIGVSHDWPRRVEWFGDYDKLFADRPGFLESARDDGLGSPPAEEILNFLRPRYWFSGHMHVKYSAVVEHRDDMNGDIFKDVAISSELRAQLPTSMFRGPSRKKKSAFKSPPQDITNTATRFLALDKPGPGRGFLELLEIESSCTVHNTSGEPYMQRTSDGRFALHYDEEWLCIIRSSSNFSDIGNVFLNEPLGSRAAFTDIAQQNLHWIQENVTAKGLLMIPVSFERHAPIYHLNDGTRANEQPCEFPNSQTREFCMMIQIPKPFSIDDDMAEVEDHIIFE